MVIIDRQFPFKYTIASISTDVMVWNAVYDAHNEVACLTLGSMTPEHQIQFKNSSPYEMLQELKSMLEKEAGMERETLYLKKRRVYFLKAATPQVIAIQGGRIQKANKKSLNAKENGKGNEVTEHSLGDLNEPANYKATMLDLKSNKWIDAMNAKMQSIKDNQVGRLVDLPPDCKNMGSKWHFKKRTDMDGNVHTYKARLVAKGSTQTYVVDYEETFSPVANIRAIRILIAIATFYDYEIWQISIYGLKRASKSWNKRFDEEIKRFGFAQNVDEPCVYQKASGSNVTFPILYVIIIMGNHIPSLQSVKTYLGNCYVMKDLGEATFILGIKIYRDRSKRLIELIQSAYMDKILKRYRMDTSKRDYIPIHPEAELRVDCYCNAAFETDIDEITSQTGYVFILNGRSPHKLNT
uniref:Retrotransposon protein, putative, Ty1-copia subclass n=1 Tax=Tanacetum cinerariifolium TaxID=118510 RepID=A0A699GTG0_TANCI|nr:retrotransposon protein, putative, Ty1-copia subclass [Tanacetum cinerariifolium]